MARGKQVQFHPGAIREWQSLPEKARERAIHELERICRGERPADGKPIRGVGSGVVAIRIGLGRAFRVICATRYHDAVHVLVVFEKKSRKMPRRIVELARRRNRQLTRERGGRSDGESIQ